MAIAIPATARLKMQIANPRTGLAFVADAIKASKNPAIASNSASVPTMRPTLNVVRRTLYVLRRIVYKLIVVAMVL